MTPEQRRNAAMKLEAAARLVDETLDRLDTSERVCDCCGRPTFVNPLEWRTFDKLKAEPARLYDMAKQLRSGRLPDAPHRRTRGGNIVA